jgi:hypothetical protein
MAIAKIKGYILRYFNENVKNLHDSTLSPRGIWYLKEEYHANRGEKSQLTRGI